MTETCTKCGKEFHARLLDGVCVRCRYGPELKVAPEVAAGAAARDNDDEVGDDG